ncbi:aspartyl protease family protein [Pedobacter sp. PLR]|uniref:aspartyl protease family protein n=1 Tax=Pedobacter sp. PLR TaxID=2994465 RepID=UPI0022452D3F|nr:aspartyl protease family protein [Pedobacter sp. PLR]MCX2452198.1 aspartyl protease family protein [Pedobacter sp. PLR]
MNRYIILLCSMVFSIGTCVAQVFNASLPYHVTGGKMVVSIIVDGNAVPFIFDTGGQTSISSKLKNALGLNTITNRVITDVNNVKVNLEMVKIPTIATPDGKAVFTQVNSMVIDNEVFACFDGAVGLFGSDMFKNCSIEIDDKSKTIHITNEGKLSLNGRKQVYEFTPTSNGMPVFSMNVGSYTDIDVLFDSGASSALLLKSDDFRKLLGGNEVSIVKTGKAIGSIGVNGFGPPGNRYLINMPEFKLGSQKFLNYKSGSSNSPESLLGLHLLDYGKVTIDYINKLFYFEPYQTEPITDYEKKWDIDLFVKDQKLVVAAIWDDVKTGVKLGDQVTHINGKAVAALSLCESMTKGIPELKNSNAIELTVKTDEGIKKITIKKT